MGGAHVQYMIWIIIMQSLNIKEWKLFELQMTPSKHFTKKMSKFTNPQNEKKIMKCTQIRRCIASMYEQSLWKIWMYRNENWWSNRLHKPDIRYAFRMEKMSKFNTCKNVKIFIKCTQNRMRIFNVWTTIMQSFNTKGWNLFELQITQTWHPPMHYGWKMSKFNTRKKLEMMFMKHYAPTPLLVKKGSYVFNAVIYKGQLLKKIK